MDIVLMRDLLLQIEAAKIGPDASRMHYAWLPVIAQIAPLWTYPERRRSFYENQVTVTGGMWSILVTIT